jgi:copper homeostasis protein
MTVEVCANSFESAINAEKAGAQRVELCSELAVGGITPSFGLIKKVVEKLSIPVFVLIRPRSGNFTYSDEEFEIMKQDIQLCKDLGCAGIVSGVLNKGNTIDVIRTKELLQLCHPLQFTFHRAFDWVPNPLEALEQLIKLKVKRVLTSGQQESSQKGITLLTQLKERAKNKITILPGGGINVNNAILFKDAGFSEIHLSASKTEIVNIFPKVSMNSNKLFDETIKVYSDITIIKKIIDVIKVE